MKNMTSRMKFDSEKLAAIEHVGSPLLVTAGLAVEKHI